MGMLLITTGAVFAGSFGQSSGLIGIETYQYLVDGRSRIADNGDGSVTVSGYTIASEPIDTVILHLYLQYWDGMTWVDVKDWWFTRSNDWQVDGDAVAWVQPGNKYRARGVHQVKNGSVEETGYSFSDPIIP